MTDEKNTQGKQGTPPPPQPPVPPTPPPEIDRTIHVQCDCHCHEKPSPKWFRSSEFWMAVANGLLVLVGIVTAIVLIGQLKLLRTQIEDSENDGEISRQFQRRELRALVSQAQNMRDSVVTIQKQTRQDQRAWISADIEANSILVKQGQPIKANIRVENVGKTPATNFNFVCILKVVENRKPLKFSYDKLAENAHFRGTVWTTSTPISYPVQSLDKTDVPPFYRKEHQISEGEMNSLNRGDSYVIAYGRVTYLDIFGVKQETRFCGWHATVSGVFTAFQCTAYNHVSNN